MSAERPELRLVARGGEAADPERVLYRLGGGPWSLGRRPDDPVVAPELRGVLVAIDRAAAALDAGEVAANPDGDSASFGGLARDREVVFAHGPAGDGRCRGDGEQFPCAAVRRLRATYIGRAE